MLTTKRGFNPFVDPVGERSNLTEHGLTTIDRCLAPAANYSNAIAQWILKDTMKITASHTV